MTVRRIVSGVVLAAGILAAVAACAGRPGESGEQEKASGAPAGPAPDVQRGKYLVMITGCNDCHTPLKVGPNGPEPDMARLLSGHPETLVMPPPPKLPEGAWAWIGAGTNTAFAGPFGISYASNITSDPVSGLGPWSEEMFLSAMKTGRHWGEARPILPPMPWQTYAQMTEADLKAIFAYLKTVPPVSNNVPPSEPAEAP